MIKTKPVTQEELETEMSQKELVMNIFRNKDEALYEKISNEGDYSTRVLNRFFRLFMGLILPIMTGLTLGYFARRLLEMWFGN